MDMLEYFREVIREFAYIRWLSIRRTVLLSLVVIIVALASGFFLGAFDGIFSSLLKDVI